DDGHSRREKARDGCKQHDPPVPIYEVAPPLHGRALTRVTDTASIRTSAMRPDPRRAAAALRFFTVANESETQLRCSVTTSVAMNAKKTALAAMTMTWNSSW